MFRQLRRKNKKLSSEECISVLKNEKRGVLSVIGDEGYPYGMPMNHFYDERDGKIYFHCGKGGHRADALAKDSRVSFCTYDKGYRLPDNWPLYVKSVIVFGRITVIDDPAKIADITTRLSHKFIEDDEYIKAEIEKYGPATLLLELIPEHICGKLVEES